MSEYMEPSVYQRFTASTFICNHDPDFALLRAGLELAEEYIEFRLLPSTGGAKAVAELGDILYWNAQIANILQHHLKPEPNAERLGEVIVAIAGRIKRIYRDDEISEYYAQLPQLLNRLYFTLSNHPRFEEIQKYNVNKLSRRKAENKIQGEGDDR